MGAADAGVWGPSGEETRPGTGAPHLQSAKGGMDAFGGPLTGFAASEARGEGRVTPKSGPLAAIPQRWLLEGQSWRVESLR
ncbi:hypothetical protein NDU88_004721 [Pleurodeles waltl]|uniref:Uncharacterized protein n=1 Tax=Pleurodeles waltl TaxID=8319 RepID=A0AAV7UH82_PLEWA|nr:hypothetical protein NDU88_004721 [Pleurodeles waltl]